MHHSKSSNLLQPGVTTEHVQLTNSQRARRRSSLDTFVIPGRTRIPSSKASKHSETGVTDFLITQGLLHHSMMQIPNQQQPSVPKIQYQGRGTWSRTGAAKSSPRSEGQSGSNKIQSRLSRVRPELVTHPPPRYGSRGHLQVPHQLPQSAVAETADMVVTRIVPQGHPTYQEFPKAQSFDGPNESNDSVHAASRTTSMTWSYSQRDFSASSTSSQRSGASQYLAEYNKLAEKHGLRPIPQASSDNDDDVEESKTTVKSHHGWLARNIFRRTSSTYTLKAKKTYQPLTRKKSLGGMPLLSSNSVPKNIITGKSLEELGRLGGLCILILPDDFAVDKVILPTSLSAIAAYLLQNGCNAPGLFRISGQASTINALYDFYDHQFSDAGSPSKVEATVGSGLLPTHIEYTLPDVASLFKKILIGLPGGLLGSLGLFEAFRDILLKLQRDPEQVEVDFTALKAKLVALAISSVDSNYRVYLIEAVLGLCAYFAFETDKAQAELAATALENKERPNPAKSELMGHQQLGVVLGPLLLGNLVDKVEITPDETLDGAPRKSSESAKRSKKAKRITISNKLETDSTLKAHVFQANQTATVMQQVLIIWRDVVKQLKDLNDMKASSLTQSRSTSRIKKISDRLPSRLTLKPSEEGPFVTFLQGSESPMEFKVPVQMKRKVRISSRSPMLKSAIKISKISPTHGSGLPQFDQQQAFREDDHTDVELATHNLRQSIDLQASTSTQGNEVDAEDSAGLKADKRTPSDLAMDEMAMGTILPRLPGLPDTPISKRRARFIPAFDQSEDEHEEAEDSSGEAPQTVVRFARTPIYGDMPKPMRQRRSLDNDKPLPLIGSAQRAEKSSPPSGNDSGRAGTRGLTPSRRSSRRSLNHSSPRTLFPARHGRHTSREDHVQSRRQSREMYFPDPFPPRQDSLPTAGHLQSRPIETYESIEAYQRARSHGHISPTKLGSRKASQANMSPAQNFLRILSNDRVPPTKSTRRQGSAVHVDSEQLFGDPRRNNVKLIAEQFSEKSKAQRKEAEAEAVKKNELPKVYAYVQSLPGSKDRVPENPLVHDLTNSNNDDPFVSSSPAAFAPIEPEAEEPVSPEKGSMIPKPVFDIGRERKAESCSPSPYKLSSPPPPKRAAPQTPGKRPPIYNVVPDQDAEIVRRNTMELSVSPARAQREATMNSTYATNANSLGLPQEPPSQIVDVSTTRPSASASSENLVFHSSHEEHGIVATHPVPKGIAAIARSESPTGTIRSNSSNFNSARPLGYTDAPLSRSNSFLQASNDLKKLEKHGSLNATLFLEISRLRQQLQQKGEEVATAKRGVEVLKVVEGKKSLEKERTIDEIGKARREVDEWRMRAEAAERRLAESKSVAMSQGRDQGTSPGMMQTAISSKDQGTSPAQVSLGGPPRDRPTTPGWVRNVREPTAFRDQRVDIAKLGQRSPHQGSRTPSSNQRGIAGSPDKRYLGIRHAVSRDQESIRQSQALTHLGINESRSLAAKQHGMNVEVKVWEGSEEEHRCGSGCEHWKD